MRARSPGANDDSSVNASAEAHSIVKTRAPVRWSS